MSSDLSGKAMIITSPTHDLPDQVNIHTHTLPTKYLLGLISTKKVLQTLDVSMGKVTYIHTYLCGRRRQVLSIY